MKTLQDIAKPTHKVRHAKLRDVPKVARIFEEAVRLHFDYFSPDYTQRVLKQNTAPRIALSVMKPNRIVLLAISDGSIKGYAFGSLPQNGRAQLYWLYVDPETRGQNIGLSLLSKMLQAVQKKGATELQLVTYRYTPYYARQGFKSIKKIQEGGVEQDMMRFEF